MQRNVNYKRYRVGNYYVSNVEIKDLVKALIGISLAFSVAFTGGRVLSTEFMFAFVMSLLVVGIGFIFHEFAHKILAQKYGCLAEFRSNDSMLFIAVLIAFSGFIFIAPGAVMIGGRRITREENGKISAAGPLTNIVLALIFYGLSLILRGDFIPAVMEYGFMLNGLLAAFNMLPVGNFDGRKVLKWNKLVWVVMMLVSAILFGMAYMTIF
ncbi:MAG: site-2 protease family protein [Nanoarchaeota archaeon]|nr:site-2 protease family protein [Nanoarchaeota archaeon]